MEKQKLTPIELKKMKAKRRRLFFGSLFSVIFISSMLYVINVNTDTSRYGIIIVNIFLYIFLILTILSLIGALRIKYNNPEEMKIITTVVVKEIKKFNMGSGIDSDGSSNIPDLRYRLFFEENEYIAHYDVITLKDITVGSSVNVEISELGKWILKIEHNSRNIENGKNMK